jgi:hypothetical protein
VIEQEVKLQFMSARGYRNVIVGLNAASILWWTLDFLNPMWGWLETLIPVYLAALAVPVITIPLWYWGWRSRKEMG